jgi:uncharacterized protein (AIM24 family)
MAEYMAEYIVQASTGSGMSLENPYCVRYVVDGRMVARQGAMVAYRGDLTIRTLGQGVRKFVKRAVSGEGLGLMEVEGRGEIWLADLAKNVFVIAGDGLSVAGKSVLCFDDSMHYDIRLIKGAGMNAGGLFNTHFTGAGSIAVTAHGQPMVIPVRPTAAVFVDTDAVIGWTASLTASIHRSEGLKSLIKGGAGEMFQLHLQGDGSVIVQPSEGPPPSAKGKGVADAIGGFLA